LINKKIVLSTITAMALATSASAFMGIGVDAGSGIWKPELNGDINYKGGTIKFDNLGMEDNIDTENNYIYLNVTHFLPVIPNARIEKLNYSILGNTVLSSNLTFNNKTFNTGNTLKTKMEMTQIDYIAYWSIPLLNTTTAGILDLNYGLDIKQLTGTISFDDEEKSFDEMVPLFYLNAIVDVPMIPVELFATTKTLSYKGTKISDSEVKASITLPIPLALIDFKIDIGYKLQNIAISDKLIDDLNANIDTKGPFIGISAKF